MTMITRILVSAVVASALVACGGGGGGANGTDPAPVSVAKNRLFAYDAGHNGVLVGFPTLTLTAGATTTVNVFTTSAAPTGGLAYDGQHDLLYATTAGGIAVYEHASQLDGNIAPARVLHVDPKSADALTALFYDKQHDILYASGALGSSSGVLIALNAPASLSGTVTPSRTMYSIPQGTFTIDTTRNILYIKPRGLWASLVYEYRNIDTLNGGISIDVATLITPANVDNLYNVAIDANNDRLYFMTADGVRFVDAASTRGHDFRVPDYVASTLLAIPVPANYNAALAYDAGNDRLYAARGNMAYQFDSASKILAGATSANAIAATLPAGTIAGAIAVP